MIERPDANKTHLTRVITAVAMTWLFERGFKPLAAEVPIRDGWVADAAGAAVLTPTEAINIKIIRKRPICRLMPGLSTEEWTRQNEAHREAIGTWRNDYANIIAPMTCLLEVKTTAADFNKDATRKFACERQANLCYLATPPGLIPASKHPAGWGILECTSDRVRVIRPATLEIQIPAHQRAMLIWNIGVRIDHDKRYDRMRAIRKEQVDRSAENRFRGKLSNVAYMVRELLAGNDPFKFSNLPDCAKKAIEECAKELRKKAVA